jgi:hypothetical protein
VKGWQGLGQPWRCSRTDCNARLGVGSRVWYETDGTVLCEEHGKQREQELTGDAGRTCVVCGGAMPDDKPTWKTCDSKCRSKLRRRNAAAAREADEATAGGL